MNCNNCNQGGISPDNPQHRDVRGIDCQQKAVAESKATKSAKNKAVQPESNKEGE